MKNNKGISIIMLVITIILMLILTSIAVYYSSNIAPEARLAAAYTSLGNVKEACTRALTEIDFSSENIDEFYFFGNVYSKKYTTKAERDALAVRCGLENSEALSERTYEIGTTDDDENRRRVENLELSGISQTYLVDLDNDNYYLVDGVRKADGTKVYEYRDIMASYQMLTRTH